MITFKDYRLDRQLTQAEAAWLAGVSLITVKRWERKRVEGSVLNAMHDIETRLANGPTPFVRDKLVDVLTNRRLSRREVARLRLGAHFAVLGYHDKKERTLKIYRVMTSRYAREVKEESHEVEFQSEARPVFLPLIAFYPRADAA